MRWCKQHKKRAVYLIVPHRTTSFFFAVILAHVQTVCRTLGLWVLVFQLGTWDNALFESFTDAIWHGPRGKRGQLQGFK